MMRDTVEARQSLKRSRGLGGSRLAGRSLLFNYVQTGPLTRFRTGLAPSAGPAQSLPSSRNASLSVHPTPAELDISAGNATLPTRCHISWSEPAMDE